MTDITDPALPAEERLAMLDSVARVLSPMHPKDWDLIAAERDRILLEEDS